jgi:hypothetical protein
MYYLRARYYNPAHGAFVSQDALETPNRYAYVGGNVVNRVDPSGMQAVCIAGVTCPITPITPGDLPFDFDPPISGVPNWGDALGLELCLWVNSGMCTVSQPDIGLCPPGNPFCAIMIMPNLQSSVTGQTDDELSRRCKAGQGAFNAACQELLRRCNANPGTRACGLRSTCTREYEFQLNREVDLWCNEGRCRGRDSCPELAHKLMSSIRCIDHRWRLVDQCYQGAMDSNHQIQVTDAYARIPTCIRFILADEAELRQYGATRRPCYEYWNWIDELRIGRGDL